MAVEQDARCLAGGCGVVGVSDHYRVARCGSNAGCKADAGKVVGNELRRLQALLLVGRIGRDGLNTKQVEQSFEACIEISVNSCKYGGQSFGGCHFQRLVVMSVRGKSLGRRLSSLMRSF